MARSLSLAAYMAWARRSTAQSPDPSGPRPSGELIWGHADTLSHANALVQLARRLEQLRPGLTLLLTTPPKLSTSNLTGRGLIAVPLPEDSVQTAEAFLAHWQPDICLWTGGDLQPAILTCADKSDVPLYLVDAVADRLVRSGWRWFPDLPRALLRSFSMILARDRDTEKSLRRLGVSDAQINVAGVFQEGTLPLPCNETDRSDLSGHLGSRPVWLAAMIHLDELDTIIAAHRNVSRMSHRLFLILVPEKPDDGPVFAQRLAASGLDFMQWSHGDIPDDTTQVLLADTYGEMGLWYRLATITFMGSSLIPGHGGQDPNEPAAHGSAILYGPNVGRHLSAYKRFAKVGAARIVRDEDTLGAALIQLIAPDQSAAMAHAAWGVASVGAEVADRVLDLVQDTLDVLEAG